MIGYLRGRVLQLTPESLILDVGGVGYAVHIPLSTYYELESHQGAEVGLHVHTHVREDTIALFGFISEMERALFEKLVAVSGIGPKLARVALSGLPAETLVSALASGDVARLATIPGVGKKTAERMVLELKDKVTDLVDSVSTATAPATAADDEIVTALVNLGYRQAAAEKAVAEVRREAPDEELSQVLRLALKRLARL